MSSVFWFATLLFTNNPAPSAFAPQAAPIRVGWLLFRLGQPVMAFHQGSVQCEGLEALLAIEHDALEVENDVLLHELTMNALRSTMREHPGSVLHLEHHDDANSGGSWWSSVRLPSTSWRRARGSKTSTTLP